MSLGKPSGGGCTAEYESNWRSGAHGLVIHGRVIPHGVRGYGLRD